MAPEGNCTHVHIHEQTCTQIKINKSEGNYCINTIDMSVKIS